MNRRDALLALVRDVPPDEPVTAPAGWIQSLLASDVASPANVDLSGAAVAELLGRSPVTVATWCRTGLFPGAYRCRNREWRIPAAAIDEFQRQQRGAA